MVALLAEGVDRNNNALYVDSNGDWVALLAEGVDRNKCRPPPIRQAVRRPPRGGRG